MFYSPVAWVLLVLFIWQCSSIFCFRLEWMARNQEFAMIGPKDLSSVLFSQLWEIVNKFYYLLLPLLTMGVLSQEFSRGTAKLLYSAPISTRHIVLGKYLGLMLYGLLLMGILLIYFVIGCVLIEHCEWRAALTGLLGVYLLYGLYAAIGIFMSSLTNYPIISAIGMFMLLSLFNMTAGWLQEYAFFRELMYWLNMKGRTDTFIAGMIGTEDVLYFILLSVLFLSLATLKLQLKRVNVSAWYRIRRYATVCVAVFLLGYITSRPIFSAYYDATTLKRNTLTETSQEIMAKLDDDLKITTYVNLFDGINAISTKQVLWDRDRYDQYVRFKPETKMDHIFYYYTDTTSPWFVARYPGKTLRQVATENAHLFQSNIHKYLTLEELAEVQRKNKIDLSTENYRYIAVLERGNGQRAILRKYNDQRRLPTEQEISAALQRLVRPVPRVGFLTGHNERSIMTNNNRDYTGSMVGKDVRSSLLTIGFDFENIDLSEKADNQLDSLCALVIADPRQPLDEDELASLKRYIDRGGNLLVLVEPGTCTYLQPIMDELGLAFEPGMLVQRPVDEYPANILLCASTSNMNAMGFKGEELYMNTGVGWESIVMPTAVGIEQVANKGFKVLPLLYSRDSLAWNEMNTIDFVNNTARVDQAGESVGSKTTMLALERSQAGRQQRIIVLGDADCLSMGELSTSRRKISSANGILNFPIFQWLSYGELPLDTRRPDPVDNVLRLSWEDSKTLKGVLEWGFPIVLLVVGAVLLIRRRRK